MWPAVFVLLTTGLPKVIANSPVRTACPVEGFPYLFFGVCDDPSSIVEMNRRAGMKLECHRSVCVCLPYSLFCIM